MNKWLNLLLLTIVAFALTACGSTDEPAEEASAEKDVEEVEEAVEEEDENELDALEIYEEALNASQAMESAEAYMEIKQTMTLPDEEPIHTLIESDIEMTMEPITLYQNMLTSMSAGDENLDMEMEMYVTEEFMYVYEESIGEWIKADTASLMGDLSEATNQPDPAEQLEFFREFASDFEVEETDDKYILKLNADDEEFRALSEEMVSENIPPEVQAELEEQGENPYEDMAINAQYFEIYLNKETYDLTQFNLEMDMDMEIEGELTNFNQLIATEYHNINQLDPIEVPEEIEENAIDQSEFQ